MNAQKRGSIGVLRGIDEQTKLEYEFVKPIFAREGLTSNEFLRLVFNKIMIEGSLDFLKQDKSSPNTPSHAHIPVSAPTVMSIPTQYDSNPIMQPSQTNLIPDIEKLVLQQVHELTKAFNTELGTMKKDISMLTNVIHSVVTSKSTPDVNANSSKYSSVINDYNTLSPEVLSKLSTSSFNTLFAEQFNGITVTDYHTVVNEGLSHNTNEVFYPVTPTKSNPSPDKPTYVMQQFIAEYNKDFRSVIINYIQNKPLVAQLSIDDSKLLNYIRTRYQRLGDMDTYIRLTSLTLNDLSLIEIEELLTPLQEHAFTITRDTKYSPMSNESRFKSAFQAEFDSAWKNDITEFTTI